MPQKPTSSDVPTFWEELYQEGNLPWDTGKVPAVLADWIRARPGAGRVLIPGCGPPAFFKRVEQRPVEASVPVFKGKEFWEIWMKE